MVGNKFEANDAPDDSLVESDESDESQSDSYRINDNEVNNFRLKFDRINIEKLNKLDSAPAGSKELDRRTDGKQSNERDKNQLNANQLKRSQNEIINESDEDVSRFSKRDVINKANKSDKLVDALRDSETHLSNPINNQINNQSNGERDEKGSESVRGEKANDRQTEFNVRANGALEESNQVSNGLRQVYNPVSNLVDNRESSPANRTVDNQTSSQASSQANNQTGNQIKSQLNQINGSSQLNLNKPDSRTKSRPVKTLSSHFNSRLKARHVASGDQLRILRREGQPLRLSCLPAFHAPSRSTVNWFKNGDLIKVGVSLNTFRLFQSTDRWSIGDGQCFISMNFEWFAFRVFELCECQKYS